MDVACPKCQTEYELDDSRVPDDGVTVKCSACGHIFRARRKPANVAVPATGADEKTASRNELPPSSPSREWKLRQPSGAISTCRELTALQRWIVEGKVSRDDEISLTGETWKRLGSIPELSSFFRVVDEASRVRSYEALRPPSSRSLEAPAPGAFVSRSGVGPSPIPSAPGNPPPGAPGAGSPVPFQTASSATPFHGPRLAGSTTAGVSPSAAGGAVSRGSGVFLAPTGIPTPTTWTSGAPPSPSGAGLPPSRPPPSSGGPSSDPAFTAQSSPFDPGASFGQVSPSSGSGARRSPASALAPAPSPPPTPFPPVDATQAATGQRQTLRGPHFSVPSLPPPSLSFEAGEPKELQRARLGTTLVLLVLGLATAAVGVFAYRELVTPQVSSSPELPGVAEVVPPSGPKAVIETPPQPAAAPPSVEEPKAGGPEAAAAIAPEPEGAALDGGALTEASAKEEERAVEPLKGAEVRGPEVKAADQREGKRTFDSLLERADRLRERERPDLAMDLYGRAHELRPERVEPVAGRGLALLDLREYPAAQGALHQALALNDRYGPAIMGLAEAYRLTGDNSKAVELYQRYLEVLPEGSEAAVARNNIQRLKP